VARIFEANRHRGDYTRADLREDVKRLCAAENVPYTDATVEEALGRIGI
jgi:hypothetical protein